MSKKYLLPIVFLVQFGLLSVISFEGGLFLLLVPAGFILLAIEVNFGLPQGWLTGNIVLPIVFQMSFWLLTGLVVDLIVNYFKNWKYDGR